MYVGSIKLLICPRHSYHHHPGRDLCFNNVYAVRLFSKVPRSFGQTLTETLIGRKEVGGEELNGSACEITLLRTG